MDDREHERESLEGLVESDGWRIFWEHARNEWRGPGYIARMEAALSFGTGDLNKAKTVHETAKDIERLLLWPAQRVKELQR